MSYNTYPGSMPNYYNPYYQPQTQYTHPAPQPDPAGGILWVGSEMEAANYLMAPNSAVALWNSNAPCIYLKQTDASGRPTMKTYDLVERTQTLAEPRKDPSKEFVTREEFKALAARLDDLTANGGAINE